MTKRSLREKAGGLVLTCIECGHDDVRIIKQENILYVKCCNCPNESVMSIATSKLNFKWKKSDEQIQRGM